MVARQRGSRVKPAPVRRSRRTGARAVACLLGWRRSRVRAGCGARSARPAPLKKAQERRRRTDLRPSDSTWPVLALRRGPLAERSQRPQVHSPSPRAALIVRHSPPTRGFAGPKLACPRWHAPMPVQGCAPVGCGAQSGPGEMRESGFGPFARDQRAGRLRSARTDHVESKGPKPDYRIAREVVSPLLYGWAARRSQPVHSLAARCARGML